MKQALKSKTIYFSIALAVLGAAELNMHLVQDMLGEYYGAMYLGIAAIVAALRAVTNKPLSDK